jgi:hypothetical protein
MHRNRPSHATSYGKRAGAAHHLSILPYFLVLCVHQTVRTPACTETSTRQLSYLKWHLPAVSTKSINIRSSPWLLQIRTLAVRESAGRVCSATCQCLGQVTAKESRKEMRYPPKTPVIPSMMTPSHSRRTTTATREHALKHNAEPRLLQSRVLKHTRLAQCSTPDTSLRH